MKVNITYIIFGVILPLLNFLICYYYGQQVVQKCEVENEQITIEEIKCETQQVNECSPKLNTEQLPGIESFNAKEFDQYRSERLGSFFYPEIVMVPNTDTILLKRNSEETCQSFSHMHSHVVAKNCFAVVRAVNSEMVHNIVRLDQDIDVYGISKSVPDPSQIDEYSLKYQLNKHNEGKMVTSGFFRKVPKVNGRKRVKMKLEPFLQYYKEIQNQLDEKLSSNNIKAGDDLTVMVLNEGEIDLFMNFACSCKEHGISLSNVFIFAGSSEIIPMIEATGAMATYHVGYAAVSKKPSFDYLDRVFVDMMWYKAFSIYLLLKRKINILFQDIDFVWFKDPMKYFHDQLAVHEAKSKQTGSQVLAFFSDDGQRSHRYTPFYANSGFYYLLGNEKSEYFAWSIMTAFDAVQVLGSHQNVYTTKLMEGLAIGHSNGLMLPLYDFPNGILYHHDLNYMKLLKANKVRPYGFHMCWTQGKQDKLKYLKKSLMWYLTEECSPLEVFISGDKDGDVPRYEKKRPPGQVYLDSMSYFQAHEGQSKEEHWQYLSNKCCTMQNGAP